MPRPRRNRTVSFQPGINYFKPAGIRILDLEEVVLTVEELEAIRLKDLLALNQKESAEKMQISQPTFHRLVSEARKKIADAIVKGKAIKIEGGNYKMATPNKRAGRGRGIGFQGPSGNCTCPGCDHTIQKQRGIPCNSIKCPKCGKQMIRGR